MTYLANGNLFPDSVRLTAVKHCKFIEEFLKRTKKCFMTKEHQYNIFYINMVSNLSNVSKFKAQF